MKKNKRRALLATAAAGIVGLSALLSGCDGSALTGFAYFLVHPEMVLFIPFILHQRTTDRTELSEYDQYLEWVRAAADYMPALDSLSDYEDVQVFQRTKEEAIFATDTVTLVITYSAKNYEQKKEEVIASYEFLAEPVEEVMPQAEFTYNGYDICVIAEEDGHSEHCYYPQYFGMIGLNEEEYKIAYMAFCDVELDVIDDMTHIMDTYFRLE